MFAMEEDRLDQIGLSIGIETLDPKQHNRRTATLGRCEVSMEIVVQGDADPIFALSPLQNIEILSPLHSDFGDMDRVYPTLAKRNRCKRSQTLVQQNPAHATRSVLMRSSSTVAAA
jgi:hypothetical protein